MEENIIGDEVKVTVRVSDLVKKFKTRQDIYDYCREQSNYFLLIFRFLFSE